MCTFTLLFFCFLFFFFFTTRKTLVFYRRKKCNLGIYIFILINNLKCKMTRNRVLKNVVQCRVASHKKGAKFSYVLICLFIKKYHYCVFQVIPLSELPSIEISTTNPIGNAASFVSKRKKVYLLTYRD